MEQSSTRKKYRQVTEDERLPLTSHLEELRWRLIVVFGFIFIVFCVCYYHSERIIFELQRPIGQKLIFTAPTEAFFANLKVSILAAITLCLPVILYQLWCFLSPGLNEKERKYGLPAILGGTVCFAGGACFAYYFVLPLGLKFLLSYTTEGVQPLITIQNYLTFIIKLIIAFGVVFEYPVIILVLCKIGIATPAFLIQKRKYAVLIIAILSAVLTPPDVVSQILMIIPLLFLYEIGIWLCRIFGKKDFD